MYTYDEIMENSILRFVGKSGTVTPEEKTGDIWPILKRNHLGNRIGKETQGIPVAACSRRVLAFADIKDHYYPSTSNPHWLWLMEGKVHMTVEPTTSLGPS